MGQKFGGQFSPNSQSNIVSTTRSRNGFKTRSLSLYRALSIPIVIAGILNVFSGSVWGFFGGVGAFLLINFSISLMKVGLEAQAAYDERKISRPPSMPRKIISAIIMGLAVFFGLEFSSELSTGASLSYGIIAMSGMFMQFGFDPLRSKGHDGLDRRTTERAMTAIAKAQEKVDELRNTAREFRNRHYVNAIERVAISAEDMFRQLEDDPEDYRNTRRYLSVYLEGASDATKKFQSLPSPTKTDEKKFLALMDELDRGFRKQQENIAKGDSQNYNIEIDVLRERLAADGIKAKE